MKTRGKRRGPPPMANPKVLTAGVKVKRTEMYELRQTAAAAGLSVSAYLRRKLGLDKEETHD